MEEDEKLAARKAPWNASAASYAEMFEGQVTQSFTPLLDAVGVTNGTSLLDIATGPGLVAGTAAERGAVAQGIDFAEGMIEAARQLYPNLNFVQADAAELPFAEHTFDAATMSLALFMLPDPDKALEEALRVLKPGGRFAATVWDWPVPGFEAFYGPFERYMGTEERLSGSPPLLGVADRPTLAAYLERAGFQDVRVSSLPITWQMPSADRLFDSLASMRNLSSLTDEQLQAFRADVASEAEQWRDGEQLNIPFPMLMLSGRRPLE